MRNRFAEIKRMADGAIRPVGDAAARASAIRLSKGTAKMQKREGRETGAAQHQKERNERKRKTERVRRKPDHQQSEIGATDCGKARDNAFRLGERRPAQHQKNHCRQNKSDGGRLRQHQHGIGIKVEGTDAQLTEIALLPALEKVELCRRTAPYQRIQRRGGKRVVEKTCCRSNVAPCRHIGPLSLGRGKRKGKALTLGSLKSESGGRTLMRVRA